MELEKCNAVVMMIREYRKGNWSLEETLVLIDVKKLDEERRMVKNSTPSNAHSTTTMLKASGELRWKWIEEYCWKKGCLRSQNQCNDKWDNLMRDFKKVREFERRRRRRCDNEDEEEEGEEHKFNSYWNMDKVERKNHNLPSSMLPQIYEALNHVMEAKLGISVLPAMVLHRCPTAPPPLPPPLPEAARLPSPTEETSTKKKRSIEEGRCISEEISASLNELADAMRVYEEREESRHIELYSLHQKRYKIEESNIEMERQGYNGMVDAINNLSNSILAFTSQRTPLQD